MECGPIRIGALDDSTPNSNEPADKAQVPAEISVTPDDGLRKGGKRKAKIDERPHASGRYCAPARKYGQGVPLRRQDPDGLCQTPFEEKIRRSTVVGCRRSIRDERSTNAKPTSGTIAASPIVKMISIMHCSTHGLPDVFVV
jgi:hypothetical protein